MLVNWLDLNRPFADMNTLWRDFDRLTRGMDGRHGLVQLRTGSTPRVRLVDAGEEWTLTIDVPGLTAADIDVQIEADELSVAGERTTQSPEGYRPLRQERSDWRFKRSFRMPSRIDAAQSSASVTEGVLTVHLHKAASDQPHRIEVKAGGAA